MLLTLDHLKGPSNEPDFLSYLITAMWSQGPRTRSEAFSILDSFSERYSCSKIKGKSRESQLPVLFMAESWDSTYCLQGILAYALIWVWLLQIIIVYSGELRLSMSFKAGVSKLLVLFQGGIWCWCYGIMKTFKDSPCLEGENEGKNQPQVWSTNRW